MRALALVLLLAGCASVSTTRDECGYLWAVDQSLAVAPEYRTVQRVADTGPACGTGPIACTIACPTCSPPYADVYVPVGIAERDAQAWCSKKKLPASCCAVDYLTAHEQHHLDGFQHPGQEHPLRFGP